MRLTWMIAFAAGCAAAGELTLAEKEEFLRTAKVIQTRSARGGITGSLRATLSDGKLTHDAQIQSIDESKARFEGSKGVEINFRDTYKFNIAGYRLAKMLGIATVPPSVERSYQGKLSAFTWWLDDVMMDEAARMQKKLTAPDTESWNQQMHRVRVFDQLIYNTDRNLGNLLITKNWELWMIDHTRAFRTSPELLNAKNLVQCDRALLAEMKKLDTAGMRAAMGGSLTNSEIAGVLKRRDKIVAFFEANEARLYTMKPRP